jgi:hypothetical protein
MLANDNKDCLNVWFFNIFFKPETELVVAWLRWSLHPLLVYRVYRRVTSTNIRISIYILVLSLYVNMDYSLLTAVLYPIKNYYYYYYYYYLEFDSEMQLGPWAWHKMSIRQKNDQSCLGVIHSGKKWTVVVLKGILSTSCVIFSYPKLLSISVLTFIKWRLTPSYVAKDTIFW